MICPSCQKTNDLSWKRYWKSPLGNHKCQFCHAEFRMAHTIKYYFTISILIIGCAIPSLLAYKLTASYALLFIVYVGGTILIVFPMDKKIGDTWRGTVIRKK
jgi:hypothetical protein